MLRHEKGGGMKTSSGNLLSGRTRAAIALLWVIGSMLTVLLMHSAWQGDPSAAIIRLGKPKCAILLAGACWLAGAYLLARRRGQAAALTGRLVLLGFSLVCSLAIGEWVVRRDLRQFEGNDGFGNLHQWAAGEKVRTKSFTPLAVITRLSSNPRLIYELQPGLNMRFGHRTLRTNSNGMREDRDYGPGATGVVRIVGIGDSGMFGWNVNQGQEYLGVLETLLDRRAPRRYEVLNLAVPGYNTSEEVEMLRVRGLPLSPRIVVLGWCDNDFGAPFLVTKKKDFSNPRKSYLYSLLFYRTELLTPEVCKPNEIDKSLVDPRVFEYTGVAGVRKALAELRDMAQQAGFRVLVFGAMNRQAVDICRELGLAYYNTRERLNAKAYPADYGVQYMHPSAEGHGVLAEKLLEELQRLGWLD